MKVTELLKQTLAVSGTRRPLVVDEVVSALSSHIRSQNLRPGDRLPTEADFASSLQCSRNVLREAVGRLSALGLVEIRRGTGMFVGTTNAIRGCATLLRSSLEISRHELIEFTEFRSVLEGYAARQAALHASDDELAELTTMAARIDDPEVSREESLRRDQAFHLRLMEIGGNRLMVTVLESLLEFLQASMDTTTVIPRDITVSRKLHMAITEALCRRDPDAAEEAVELNRQHTLSRLSVPPASERDPHHGPAST